MSKSVMKKDNIIVVGVSLLFSGIAALVLLTFSFIFLIFCSWLMLINKYDRFRYGYNILMRPLGFLFNFMVFLRMKVIGKEYVDPKRKTLYICNHQSWYDIPTFNRACRAATLSKKEALMIPIVGFLTAYAGTIFFDRDNPRDRIGILKDIMQLFKRGHSLCIFPEGTRSRDGTLGEPQFPVLKLCYKQKIPVVPAAIEGTKNILKRDRLYYKFFQKVVIKYTPPIKPEEFDNVDDFCNACWDRVKETHAEIVEQYFLEHN